MNPLMRAEMMRGLLHRHNFFTFHIGDSFLFFLSQTPTYLHHFFESYLFGSASSIFSSMGRGLLLPVCNHGFLLSLDGSEGARIVQLAPSAFDVFIRLNPTNPSHKGGRVSLCAFPLCANAISGGVKDGFI